MNAYEDREARIERLLSEPAPQVASAWRFDAEAKMRALTSAIEAFPAEERQDRIEQALAGIAEHERRKALLDQAKSMDADELERRLG